MRGSPGPRLRVGSAVGAHGSQTRDRSAQPVRTPGLGMRVVRGTGIPCNPRVTGGETGLLSGRSLWRQHRSGWAVLSGCRGMPALGPVGCERPESSVVQTQPHVSRAGPRLQPSQPEPWTLRLSRPTSRPEHTVPPETETVSIARGGTTHTHTHTPTRAAGPRSGRTPGARHSSSVSWAEPGRSEAAIYAASGSRVGSVGGCVRPACLSGSVEAILGRCCTAYSPHRMRQHWGDRCSGWQMSVRSGGLVSWGGWPAHRVRIGSLPQHRPAYPAG